MLKQIRYGRIATVKRTGEVYLLQCKDVNLGLAHCWGDVISFKENPNGACSSIKFDGVKKFRLDEVDITEVQFDAALYAKSFAQARKSDKYQTQIMSGDVEVVLKNGARFASAPKSRIASETHRCPQHGAKMRLRSGPAGGKFWACPTRSETECNFTCALNGTWSKDAQEYMSSEDD